MQRRTFLRNGCLACTGLVVSSAWFSGCSPVRRVTGTLEGDQLKIPLSAFELKEGEETTFLKYVVARHPDLAYPLAVFRLAEQEFTALWMECPHQGTTLQVSGDLLTCPSHDSEFDKRGALLKGPAESGLRLFETTAEAGFLFIALK